jgi:hypothetical protein
MLTGLARIAALAFAAAALAGCAGEPAIYGGPRGDDAPGLAYETPQQMPQQDPLQCVPFARDHSSVKLYGDAWTWWDKAAGKFPREAVPEAGAVMVLTGYAGPERGHVAVVRTLVSPREIRVDHANWLGDGGIYLDDPVRDVSAGNDWSAVKVWNVKTAAWGVRIYPVQGFIGPGGDARPGPNAPMVAQTPDQIALLNLIKSQ